MPSGDQLTCARGRTLVIDKFYRLIGKLLLLLVFAGCSEKPNTSTSDIIPRVKTITVSSGGEVRTRMLVGEVQPVEVWNLAFPIQGRVVEIFAVEGDHVKKGQLLARLEPLVYQLKLNNAEADLRSTTSERAEKRDALEAQTQLKARGFMTNNMLEKYRVEYALAEQRFSNSQASVALAKRDLDNTRLLAPATGTVSARQIEPFTDVTTGQSVMRMDGATGMHVAIRVPDNLVGDMAIGTSVSVTIGEGTYKGKVSRIAARAGVGDSFQVFVRLSGAADALRPGVTAKVTVALTSSDSAKSNIQVPIYAVLPGDSPGKGFMFVMDKSGDKVKRVAVSIQAVNETAVEINEGLAVGDEVVTAGVAFLSSGQAVKRMTTVTRDGE
jgi:RND family efflux transporter MFP subunit